MLNCFAKKLFGLLFMAIYYFSVDLGYKLPKTSAALCFDNVEHGCATSFLCFYI